MTTRSARNKRPSAANRPENTAESPAPQWGNLSATHEPWLVDPATASKLLSISRSRVFELKSNGNLPSLTIGRSRRIRLDELWRWLEAQAP
jgi:excisionase family DNA binding protein